MVYHTKQAYQAELSRNQMFGVINNKFYMHKSFDAQSDLEFMPSLPTKVPVTATNSYGSMPVQTLSNPSGLNNIPKASLSMKYP